jgi:hypothetical protein
MEQKQQDMIAIELSVIVDAINNLDKVEADLDEYVLVVPKDAKDAHFYIMEKAQLIGGYGEKE